MSHRGSISSAESSKPLAEDTSALVVDRYGKPSSDTTWTQQQLETQKTAYWRIALYENRTLASAITAAITGMLVGYPFDSLKTRMQTNHYPSLIVCARRSIAEEGFSGLYRGLLPPLLTASIAKSLSFSLFEKTKLWLRQNDPYMDKHSPLGMPDFQRKTAGSIAFTAGLSGAVSGTMIAALCCPLELVKVQMQLAKLLNKRRMISSALCANPDITPQSNSKGEGAIPRKQTPSITLEPAKGASSAPSWARSNLSVIREIIQRRGATGLYYGIGLHMLRDASGTAIYFAAYETVKETLRRVTGSETTGPMTHMLAGGTCGVLSWLLIFPVDLIKSGIQSQALQPKETLLFSGPWHCARSTYSKLGITGLYRGVSVSLIRAFPIHGLNFVVYEWARSTICWLAGCHE
ncbi:hypothetical protein EV178_002984 [Coemansia sp. RSA 1646]|nr:hypothetical protein EV178_002984 [Coemansia sp. RSA 1646]KAJ2090857.1 hypothetical protein IW138_002260 [Coemansia sp. RSA 986]